MRSTAEHPDLLMVLRATDPASTFALVALILGALLIALTPPFQVPDEPNHFYRAYQVAEGGLVPETTSNSVGGVLPRSLQELSGTVMGNVPFNPRVKQDLDVWARAFEIPLRPDDRTETAFPNTALSGPIAYAPQALGIDVARLLGASVLWVFYGGRIATLLLCVAITMAAIRWLPIRRWTCVLLSLLPMTMFVRSSLSSDGPTLALTLLFLALSLKPARPGASSIDSQHRPRLFSVATLLAFGKPPYGAVTFLALATPARLVGGMKPYVSTMLVLTLTLIAAQATWAFALRGKTVVSAPGADPQTQIQYTIEQPAEAAAFLAKDFFRSIPRLTHQALGVLGWLDAPLPVPVVVLLGILIVLVALGESGLPAGCVGFRWLAVLIGIAGALALHVMNFVWWTPPGSPFVAGIQGRHLLPFIPLLFVAIDSPPWISQPLARLRPVFVVAFLLISGAATLLTVIHRYY